MFASDRAGQVHERRGLGAEGNSLIAQATIAGAGMPPTSSDSPIAEPLALLPRPERLLERLGQRDGVGVRVEGRRVAVAVGERLRERSLGLPGRLGEHLADRLAVEVAELPSGQDLLQVEHLEQVEFEVTHVALVVAHGRDRYGLTWGCGRPTSAAWGAAGSARTVPSEVAAARDPFIVGPGPVVARVSPMRWTAPRA